MKSGIHPKWSHAAQVNCSCGNTFTTGSTQDKITVDICSKCHPFFTGEMRFVDRQGRVDKFRQKITAAATRKAAQATKATAKKIKKEEPTTAELSYKELLALEQNKLKQMKKAVAATAV